MITFNDGTTDYHPLNDIVDGYTAPRTNRTIVQPLVGTEDVAVTLRPAGPRTGPLRVLHGTLAAAVAFLDALAAAVVWTFEDSDNPGLDMSYVVVEGPTLAIDDETRTLWWVEFHFQEINP